MRTVLAALDADVAARPVLKAALGLGELTGRRWRPSTSGPDRSPRRSGSRRTTACRCGSSKDRWRVRC